MDGSGATAASYEADVLEWSREQAAALRRGDFARLDLEHLADEIEDVGKSEKRELASRMAILLAHLLKWQFQPERRSRSWTDTIEHQREAIDLALKDTPSLKSTLRNVDWRRVVWLDARARAHGETGLENEIFPRECPWTFEDAMSSDWLPSK